jgi:hypothetical protein
MHEGTKSRLQGEKGKSFLDLLLVGWAYQFWRRYRRRPTVDEMANFMALSHGSFYRRYTRAEMYQALLVACGRVALHLPDPEGLDSAQRANTQAKKRRHRDPLNRISAPTPIGS